MSTFDISLVLVRFELKSNFSGPIEKREVVTNTAAEAQAATKAIEIAHRESIKKLIIVTDSTTILHFREHRDKWEKEGWKDKDLHHLDECLKEQFHYKLKLNLSMSKHTVVISTAMKRIDWLNLALENMLV